MRPNRHICTNVYRVIFESVEDAEIVLANTADEAYWLAIDLRGTENPKPIAKYLATVSGDMDKIIEEMGKR